MNKEEMDLKESKEGNMGNFGERKGKGLHYNLKNRRKDRRNSIKHLRYS